MEETIGNTSFSKLRIAKNLTVLSVAFLLLYTAYNGLTMLQSTMNKIQGMGTAGQAVLYITYGLSSLLISSYAIKKLGIKNAQILGMFLYLPYIAANFYPSWLTIIPSAVLIGIGSTLNWGAQCTYFNECSVLYNKIINKSRKKSIPVCTSDASSNYTSNVRIAETYSPSRLMNRKQKKPVLDKENKAFSFCIETVSSLISKTASTDIPGSTDESNCQPSSKIKNSAQSTREIHVNGKEKLNLSRSLRQPQRVEIGDLFCDPIDEKDTQNEMEHSPPGRKVDQSFHSVSAKDTQNEEENSPPYRNVNLSCYSVAVKDTHNKIKHSPKDGNVDQYFHIVSVNDTQNEVEHSPLDKSVDLPCYSVAIKDNQNEAKHTSLDRKSDLSCYSIPETGTRKQKSQKSLSSTNALFFGFHGLAYCSSQIWSNLICFSVLSYGIAENLNKTLDCSCGADFCDTDEQCVDESIDEVPNDTRYLLTGLCVVCGAMAAILVWLFLDPMDKKEEPVSFSLDQFLVTIKYIKKKEQIYVIPLTILGGMIQAFYTADITKAYIACAWTLSEVGIVTVFYGIASAASSILSGALIKYLGRLPVIFMCQVLNVANLSFLLLWNPNAEAPLMFYAEGAVFGFIVGIFHTQTKALYGTFFEGDEETAFSSCNMYSSIGWSLPFLYSDFLCTSVKIYILLTLSCVGTVGYLLSERSFHLRHKQLGTSNKAPHS